MPSNEKACVLAEEIGHYKTTVGNILNQGSHVNRKKEKIARKWAVDEILTIDDLFLAAENSCRTLYEIAEFLGVTEAFLGEAIEIFRQRYGIRYASGDRTLIFNDGGFYMVQQGDEPCEI